MKGKRYVYLWANGIYCNVSMEERQCLLVIIGVTEEGKKELVALEDGFRESELSWRGVLSDLKRRWLEERSDDGISIMQVCSEAAAENKWSESIVESNGRKKVY